MAEAADFANFFAMGLGSGLVIGFLAVSISGVFAVLKAATNLT